MSTRRNVLPFLALAMILLISPAVVAQSPVLDKVPAGLHSVATPDLGATAKGSGAPWNKDWPARNALTAGGGRPLGALFGDPMTGARMDIRLVKPMDVKGVELVGLDYHFTRQVAAVDIYVDGKLVRSAELPERPGKGNFVPLDASGQLVSVVVTGEHPVRTGRNGAKGPRYGGWNRVRVYSATDLAALMADVEAYQVPTDPAFIAPTSGSLVGAAPKVYGEPRVAVEHPKTIWDARDIAHYREMLKTSEELRTQYQGLKAAMDQRIAMPVEVPQPRKNAAGEYVHVSDRETGGLHNNLALDIANLGAVYALSGEDKYAAYCVELLDAYARAYPNYGVGARGGFSHDPSKVFDQRLGDATWLIQIARGYDLIYIYPMDEATRRRIEDDLIGAAARFIAANSAHLRGATNWSAIGTCAILISGVATDDQDLIDTALWGINKGRSQKPWWQGADQANKNPSGVELHFSAKSIDDDGMWAEGAMGYQFMAMQAVLADAEILWHMGIDLYRYRGGVLKRLFDSPLEYCYPDLKTPAIHDSGHGSIVGREAYLYELGYRRYRDPKYLVILKQTGKHLAAAFQQFTVSMLYDVDLSAEAEPVAWDSVNFFGVGYGILRNTTPRGTVSALLDYGPNRSHGHPDKLNLDLWGFGQRLLPDPGSIWYEQPLYRDWYRTSVAHNTLVVDELEQKACGADQLTYLPGESLGLQRARTNGAYSGVMMDRALLVTPEYTADLFGAFARLPRKMDLCWHPVGELGDVVTAMGKHLDMAPYSFPEPREAGYNSLDDCHAARLDGGYRVETVTPATPLNLVAAGGETTELIIGKGWLGMSRPPVVLQRRQADKTVWGNVLDYSPDGFVRAASVQGGLDDGYALLTITTAQGKEFLLSAYREGLHNAGALRSDGLQACLSRREGRVVAAALAGGRVLEAEGFSLELAEPGLASLERTENGSYLLSNPAARAASVTVKLAGLKGLKCYGLDADGRRTDDGSALGDEAFTARMPAMTRLELAAPDVPSLYDYRREMLRKRMAEQEAARKATHDAIAARAAARAVAARRNPLPAGTLIVVQAEDFTDQGGGEIRVSDRKRNAIGEAVLGWNNQGHWMEWTIDAPAAGYYNLAVLYCSEMDQAERELKVNGEVADADVTWVFPATGGWSNSSDDWRVMTLDNGVAERPLLIKLRAGANTLRLTNLNGRGVNLDYLAVFSPDLAPDRETLAAEMTD